MPLITKSDVIISVFLNLLHVMTSPKMVLYILTELLISVVHFLNNVVKPLNFLYLLQTINPYTCTIEKY